jgi:hypothetical protein
MWSRLIEHNTHGIIHGKMRIENDGSILLVGSIIEENSFNFIPGIAEMLLIKIDTVGNILFTKTIKAGKWLSAGDVKKNQNNNYEILSAYADSLHNYFGVLILELNILFEPVSYKLIRDDVNIFTFYNNKTLDGGYIFNNFNGLIKTDSLLNVEWAKRYNSLCLVVLKKPDGLPFLVCQLNYMC